MLGVPSWKKTHWFQRNDFHRLSNVRTCMASAGLIKVTVACDHRYNPCEVWYRRDPRKLSISSQGYQALRLSTNWTVMQYFNVFRAKKPSNTSIQVSKHLEMSSLSPLSKTTLTPSSTNRKTSPTHGTPKFLCQNFWSVLIDFLPRQDVRSPLMPSQYRHLMKINIENSLVSVSISYKHAHEVSVTSPYVSHWSLTQSPIVVKLLIKNI